MYGDWVNANDGTHLSGRIADENTWKAWQRDLAVMPSRRYNALGGKVGQRFMWAISGELQGIREGLWNSKRFIIFQTVIPQHARHVKGAQAIRRRIVSL